jgi:hypothetical protein
MKRELGKTRSALFISWIVTTLALAPAPAAAAKPAGYRLVVENAGFTLFVNQAEGGVAVRNKETGFLWTTNPPSWSSDPIAAGSLKMALGSQLSIRYSDVTAAILLSHSAVNVVKRNGLSFREIAGGIRIDYRFVKEGITIPVEYILQEDSLLVRIPVRKIVEEESSGTVLNSITLLPYFGAAGPKDSGYLVVPDGSGALIRYNNGKGAYGYSQPVYGRDPSIDLTFKNVNVETIRLPVFGSKNGANAFLAIIESGDARAQISAETSGMKTSMNTVNANFVYRESDNVTIQSKIGDAKQVKTFERSPTPIDYFALRYIFLSGDKANYTGMAERYRLWLQEKKGLARSPLEDRYTLRLELHGGVRRTIYPLGIPIESYQPLTTFDDAISILSELAGIGVTAVGVTFTDWSRGGAESRLPVSPAPERKLGGASGFRKLVQAARTGGATVWPEVDLVNLFEGGAGYWKILDSAKTITRVPVSVWNYKPSTFVKNDEFSPWSLLSPSKLPGAYLDWMDRYPTLENNAVSLSALCSTIYSDYSRGQDRGAAVGLWEKILSDIRLRVPWICASAPNAYAFPYLDYIESAPIGTSRFMIEDEEIPFYEMVLRGVIPYSGPPINLDPDPDIVALKLIEAGADPKFLWISRNGEELRETRFEWLNGVVAADWISDAARIYAQGEDALMPVIGKKIIDHRIMGKVRLTVFEGGYAVAVNYGDAPVEIQGGTKVPARGFAAIREAGKWGP